MTAAAAATRRIDYRGGHRYLLDGEQVDGVTSILDNGVPKPALVGWAANVTADYALDHWEEMALMRPSERDKAIRFARYKDRDKAAKRGTAVHELALALAAGEEVEPPEELAGHVDAYLRFVEEWQPRELVTEVVIANRRYRYMGTLDAIADLGDGNRWLLDWKTGGKGVYPESALQLAAYRNAEFYIDPEGAEQPLPAVDMTGTVWLRADGYDLIPVETGPEIFRSFLYAQQVARFTQTIAETVIGPALTAPGVAA